MADSGEAEPESKATKISTQIKKLQEANTKYKTLLKLAKERIQQQEEEIEQLRNAAGSITTSDDRDSATKELGLDDAVGGTTAEETKSIVRVCQRLKSPTSRHNSHYEVWALFEVEISPVNDFVDVVASKRHFEWKLFDSESELQDYIRRDTGEPLKLPPYSLSPEQSAQIEEEAARKVSQITEEFRRFRVRSELARKQADAQIRDLQNHQVQSAARRIEGQDSHFELEQARSAYGQVERLKAELAAQESHWKEAYDMLLAENNALKAKGSEALLAYQWRQRYESCCKEKEDLETRLLAAESKAESSDAAKFEAKYKDLKESFRLYRKKAKEIFEAQERGISPATVTSSPSQFNSAYSDESSAESKLTYLKNLMVNYLTTDQTVRDHMEGAIATVLKFTPEEVARIEKKKAENESWF